MKVILVIVAILVFAFLVWQVALLIRDIIRKSKKKKKENEHNDNTSNDLDRKE